MQEIEGTKELVKEICPTCGDHDSKEHTWTMFPGSDIFVRMPFHAAHTTLEKGDASIITMNNIYLKRLIFPGSDILTSTMNNIFVHDCVNLD